MRSKKDPRHIARILAIMDLYQFFFNTEQLENKQQDKFVNVTELLKSVQNHAKKLQLEIIQGVKDNYQKADEIINTISTPAKVEDLELLTLTILRVAIYEGFIAQITPPKVAIDEAIELTKDFGLTESETKKVAGILGKIISNLNNNK